MLPLTAGGACVERQIKGLNIDSHFGGSHVVYELEGRHPLGTHGASVDRG